MSVKRGASTNDPAGTPDPAEDGGLLSENSISENSISENSISEDGLSADEAPGPYDIPDGVYTGTGSGYRGETIVSVTVENGRIADITIASYADDSEYFSQAQDAVIGQIVEAQSWDVQPVSGATFSSNGIIQAVANALGASFEAPAPPAPDMSGHGHGGGYGRRMRRRGGR